MRRTVTYSINKFALTTSEKKRDFYELIIKLNSVVYVALLDRLMENIIHQLFPGMEIQLNRFYCCSSMETKLFI